MTSYFDDDVIKNRLFSNDDNFVSVLRMKTVDLLFERYQMELYEYDCQKWFGPFIFADVSTFLTSKSKMTSRDLTSSDFLKTSSDCSFLYYLTSVQV